MHQPVKNAGFLPWKSSILQKETSAFHHRCAEYISDNLREQQTNTALGFISKATDESFAEPAKIDKIQVKDDGETYEETYGETHIKVGTEADNGAEPPVNSEARLQLDKVHVPEQIASIIEENLGKEDRVNQEGIWPVIWDFAGQAVYRAIHPIFMSPEGVYLLMVDLTKNLFDTALCRVKEDGYAEVEVPAPDSNDTNLDHLMRWLDLLHSLQNSGSCENLPPVILVGTHADCVKNPDEKTDDLKNTLFHSARCLSQCIVATVNVDSTQAGRMPSQEDARIVSLRKKIIDIADAMPQTKIQFPLKWLQVENEVYGEAKQGAKYKTRKQFRLEIADKVCQFEVEDDFEHLLNFLHDRGTIVNHDRADNPDGLVVLDPQWLIDVLCKIVKVKQEGDEAMAIYSLRQELGEKGILRPELLDHACKTPELSNIKDSLLFIMKKFNLLCECKGEDGKPVYLVPCMLTAKAEESLISPAIQGSQPLYITFDTNYVPTGLFSRLLVLFGAWAASRTSCKQQRLFANAALFVVGESTCLTLVCNKSVIKVDIWTMNSDANPVHTTPKICSEVFSFLDESLDRLKRECHWLHLVSWKFCGQCRLCLGKVDTNTKQCFRHQKRECSSDDCAHYVSIQDFPFCCTDAKGPDLCLPLTWIQVLRQKTSQGHPGPCPGTNCKHHRRKPWKRGSC